ncbi:CppA family protein, partial [human gut metagenome]
FVGLSQFTIEQIHINAPDKEKAVTFYQEWLGNQSILTFSQASGPDLLTESTQTW